MSQGGKGGREAAREKSWLLRGDGGKKKRGKKGKTTQLWRGGDPAEEEGDVRAARASHSAAFGAGPEGFPSARALRAGREDAPGAGISRIRDELGPWKAGTMVYPGSSRPAAAAGAAGIPTTGMKPPCRPRLGARGGILGGERPEKTGKTGGKRKVCAPRSALSDPRSWGAPGPPSLSQMREFLRIYGPDARRDKDGIHFRGD